MGKGHGSETPSKQIKREMKINITILREGCFLLCWLLYILCVCQHLKVHACGNLRITFESWFSPSTSCFCCCAVLCTPGWLACEPSGSSPCLLTHCKDAGITGAHHCIPVPVGSFVGCALIHWAISLVYEVSFCGKEPKLLGFGKVVYSFNPSTWEGS